MSGLNRAFIIGNLGKDPEMRAVTNGQVANLTIATSESWKDKVTGEKKEQTEWHRVVFFGKLADVAGEYLAKGSKVFVEGKIQTRKWTNKDGQDQYTTEIVGQRMEMLSPKGEVTPARTGSGGLKPAIDPFPDRGAPVDDDFDSDIPFN